MTQRKFDLGKILWHFFSKYCLIFDGFWPTLFCKQTLIAIATILWSYYVMDLLSFVALLPLSVVSGSRFLFDNFLFYNLGPFENSTQWNLTKKQVGIHFGWSTKHLALLGTEWGFTNLQIKVLYFLSNFDWFFFLFSPWQSHMFHYTSLYSENGHALIF